MFTDLLALIPLRPWGIVWPATVNISPLRYFAGPYIIEARCMCDAILVVTLYAASPLVETSSVKWDC